MGVWKKIKIMKKIFILFVIILLPVLSWAQEVKQVTIGSPPVLTITAAIQTNPSEFGVSDGKIYVIINGGTPFNDESYTVVWLDSGGVPLTTGTVTNEVINAFDSTYKSTLSNIGDGLYNLRVTDAKGCTKMITNIPLQEPLKLTVTIENQLQEQEISCNGETGSLTANSSGGVIPHKYEWYLVNGGTDTLLPSNDATISNLSGGVYKVKVTDNNGVPKTSATKTVFEPAALGFSHTVTNVSCFGGNNGNINISVTGGTAPYSFKWTDVSSTSTSGDRNGITSGTYYLTVTDFNSCVVSNLSSGGIVVNQPNNALSITTNTLQNVSVNGGTNGEISFSMSGGTPPYTYSWTKNGASTAYNSNTISGLTVGQYIVTVKDNNYAATSNNSGCTLVKPYTITAPEILAVSISEQVITCFNTSDGALTALGTGGVKIPTIDYTYKWFKEDTGTYKDIAQNKTKATGLGVGTYKVIITDNNGNMAENTISISQPTQLSIPFTKQDILCKGESNGSISTNVKGGTTGYSYSWTNSSGIEIGTYKDIAGLTAGAYHIKVTDNRNCLVEEDIIITEPSDALQITLDSSINPTAFQATNGAVSITVSGGTSSYTYEWTDNQNNAVSSSEDINNLGAGSYTLTVKDANFNSTSSNSGCTVSETFILTEPEVLAVNIAITNTISCFRDTNGALQANAKGGVSPYSYEWFEVDTNGVSTSLGVLTETITNLDTGLYRVQITDANTILIATDFNLVEPDVLRVNTIAITDVLCFNNTTGAIDITITGGTAPYTYFWSNGATTQDISSIASGTYNVVVTDNKNCEITQNGIIVSQPTKALSIDNAIITPLTGFETNDGTIAVFVSGGTSPYTYSWVKVGTTTVLSTENSISNLSIGNYQVTITDSNMCQFIQNYQVTQPDKLLVDIEQTLFNLCFSDSNATIKANVTGGVLPYSYRWYNLNSSTDILDFTISFENIMAGSYGVIVIDANGIKTLNTISIIQPDLLEINNVSQTDVLCYGEQTGSLDITVNGGTGTYSYIWSNGATTEDITGLSSGDYTITITDENNCSVSDTYSITQPNAALQISNSLITEPLGAGLSNGSIAIAVNGGTTNYVYAWYDENNTLLTETSATLSSIPIGTYKVIVTDNNNCIVEQTFVVNEPPILEVSLSIDTIQCQGETGSITAIASGGYLAPGASYTYQWFNSTNVQIATTPLLSTIVTGNYYVIVTDSNGIQKQENHNLTEPDLLEITNVIKTDVLCFGEQTGSLDISVSGGTGSYTYKWNNGATTEDISGLSSGDYTITITDENNCSVSDTYSITQPVLYDISSVSLMRPTGSNVDGSISIDVTGGEAPFTYQWFNSLGALVQETVNSTLNTNVLTNVEPETYTIIITDTTGCIHQDTYNLANPGELITDIEQIQVISCNGGNDGKLMANSIGGSGGNQYTWYNADTNTAVGTDNEVLSNIPSGSYYVLVSNADGLQEQSSVLTVTEPEAVQVTFTSQNASCYQEDDGSISLQATGGTEVFEYRKRLNSGLYSNWLAFTDNSISIENLISGDYELQVRDSNQCNFDINGITQTITIPITQPDVLEITSNTITDASGFGLSNGAVVLEINGGTMPYTIVWTDSNNVVQSSTDTTLSNIPAGTYTVNIRDAQGCTTTGTYTVTEPDLLEVSISQQAIILCYGDTTTLEGIATGGSGGNSYTWYDASNTVIGNATIIKNLPAGVYYVNVVDSNNNQATSTNYTIKQPTQIVVTTSSENLSCFESNNGQVDIEANGGVGNYQYRVKFNQGVYGAWLNFNSATTTFLDNLIAGDYQIQVRDDNACFYEINDVIQTIEIPITQPDILEITSNSINDASGFGLSNGAIELQVNGGTEPYIISWLDNNGVLLQESANQTLNNIPAGAYTVTITDAQQCKISDSYTVNQPDLLEVNIDLKNIILCFGDENGSLRAEVTGGISFLTGAPYVYNWYKVGNTTPLGNQIGLQNIGTGNYYVIVEDKNGNETQSATFNLTEPELLTLSLTGEYISCGTGNDWSISTNVKGGTLPYTYRWNTAASTPNIENVVAGNYLVIITDAQGCEIIETFRVEVPKVLNVDANITQVNCADACEGVIDLNITGGVAPYSINWDTGDTTTSINNLCPGDYSVSVTDQKGCKIYLEYTIENPEPILVDLGEDKTLCIGQSHDLDISIDDSNATYQWTSNNGFTSNSPSISLTETGIYTATITTVLGCIGADSIEIAQSNVGVNSQFLITTQAFAEEDIILINTSNPLSTNVQWILPNEAQVIEESNETITLRFDIPGAYEITLRSFQGNCFQDYTKPVIVEEARDLPAIGDVASPFIVDFVTHPNPTKGVFEVDITLQEEATVSLRLFSLISNIPIDNREAHSASEYTLDYNVNVATGIYFLLLETAKGSEIRKIIIE